MISVIQPFEFLACLFVCLSVVFCESLHVRLQLGGKFGSRDSAYCAETVFHADVLQTVEFAEYAYLAEFADSGNEYELQHGIAQLDDAVETAEHVPQVVLQFRVRSAVEQRGIVLVHEEDDLQSCLFVCPADYSLESFRRGLFSRIAAVFFFPAAKPDAELSFKVFNSQILCPAEIEVEDRIFDPFLFESGNRQSVEEFLLPGEICFQRCYE